MKKKWKLNEDKSIKTRIKIKLDNVNDDADDNYNNASTIGLDNR